MNWLRKLRRQFRALFQKNELDARMDDEMRMHIEMQMEENRESGMKPEEARHAALRQFGWVESIKDACRDRRGVNWIEDLGQDVRYGTRMLFKNPGFTTTAMLTVAIGIGSCAALFSLVNGVLFRPLRLPDSEQIVAIRETTPPIRRSESVTPAVYLDWVKQVSVFAHLAAQNARPYRTRLGGFAVNLGGQAVTASYFSVLGIQPFLGRGFLPDEELPGNNQAVILSYQAWRSQFGGRDNIINQTILLDDQPYTIVGVLPDINLVWNSALFTPLTFSAADRGDYGSHGLGCVGRLKPGIALEQAQAEMDVISDHIAHAHPDTNLGHGARVTSLLDDLTGGVRLQLLVLLGAVALLLLIACINVASLVLARANSRQREIAVRSGVGCKPRTNHAPIPQRKSVDRGRGRCPGGPARLCEHERGVAFCQSLRAANTGNLP